MSIMKRCERLGRWAAMGGLLAAFFFLAGCHSPPPRNYPGGVPGAASGTIPESLLFRVGDSVTIVFADLPPPPVPPFVVKIREDGTVTLLQNETFTFVGKAPGDLEKEIRDRYVPAYYKFMTVNVQPKEQTLFYYVDGEVRTPARQTYIERTTVLKAIASAGGFTDFAKKTGVKLTRVDGRKATVNCKKAIDNPILDLEVYPGDKIYVPRKIF
jgi:protein involved in polysaccharide export with SLBB domain